MKSLPLIQITVALASLSTGLYADPARPISLYTDKRAHRVEDVITVLVDENAQATRNINTQNNEKQSTAVAVQPGTGPILNHIPGLGVGMQSDQEYDGQGSTSRSGQVSATVSARVKTIYDNGNLLIEGHKEVDVNGEKESLDVSGIIRPDDIASDNTINSSKLADAKINYTGTGDGANSSTPGWWARFWHWVL